MAGWYGEEGKKGTPAGVAKGTRLRAQGYGHKATGTRLRAQGYGHKAPRWAAGRTGLPRPIRRV
eukprot:840347-Prorocentrum_minimum.AAC.1